MIMVPVAILRCLLALLLLVVLAGLSFTAASGWCVPVPSAYPLGCIWPPFRPLGPSCVSGHLTSCCMKTIRHAYL